jgi:hypothetical protein
VARAALTEELLGRYFVVDPNTGVIVERNVDLAGLGLRIGVIEAW